MKPIRDPVYDYIYITALEQRIVDEPKFQRLRFVLQNSMAFLTYPNNTNTRFLHSLGVMHLTGQMFVTALENSHDDVLKAFLEKGRKTVDKARMQLNIAQDDLMQGFRGVQRDSPMLHRRAFGRDGSLLLTEEQSFVFYVLWESVRLCALIHDIGHLPLSHVFEEAFSNYHSLGESEDTPVLKQYRAVVEKLKESLGQLADELGSGKVLDTPPHEILGLAVFSQIPPRVQQDPYQDELFRLTHRLANVIFLLNPRDKDVTGGGDEYQLLRCLHTIIASPLDADRLDYCVRDPHVSGMELGAIDVERIVESMELHRDGDNFQILPEARALPAIESFFHQRYLIYKNLVYHHNVVRMNGVAREIIVRLLEETEGKEPPNMLTGLLAEFEFWRAGRDGPVCKWMAMGHYEDCDDSWFRTLLTTALRRLEDQRQADDLLTRQKELLLLLQTLLHRKTENLYSIWKYETDYFQMIRDWYPDPSQRENAWKKLVAIPKGDVTFTQMVSELREELQSMGFILLYDYLTPKILNAGSISKGGLPILVKGTPVVCSEVSPYLRVLDSVARETPNIHFSLVAEGIKLVKNDAMRIRGKEAVFSKLRAFLDAA